MNDHFMPVGKPAPPRPRSEESLTACDDRRRLHAERLVEGPVATVALVGVEGPRLRVVPEGAEDGRERGRHQEPFFFFCRPGLGGTEALCAETFAARPASSGSASCGGSGSTVSFGDGTSRATPLTPSPVEATGAPGSSVWSGSGASVLAVVDSSALASSPPVGDLGAARCAPAGRGGAGRGGGALRGGPALLVRELQAHEGGRSGTDALVGEAVVEAGEHAADLLEGADLRRAAGGGDRPGRRAARRPARWSRPGVWLSKNSQLVMTTGAKSQAALHSTRSRVIVPSAVVSSWPMPRCSDTASQISSPPMTAHSVLVQTPTV